MTIKPNKDSNKRHVHNILPDTHTASEKLLVVEVYTDQGNWSSYPPPVSYTHLDVYKRQIQSSY